MSILWHLHTDILPIQPQNALLSWDVIYFLFITAFPLYVLVHYALAYYLAVRVTPFISSNSTKPGPIKKLTYSALPYKPLVLLLTLQVALFKSITGPEHFVWFSHFFIDSFCLSSLLVSCCFAALVFSLQVKTVSLSDMNSWLILTVWSALPYLFFTLYASSNIYTAVICIEIITSATFLLLASTQYQSTKAYSDFLTAVNSLTILFWIGTLSSISLFAFLTASMLPFNYNTGWVFGFLFTNSTNHATSLLFNFAFIFIVFLKFGLPPFLTWKFSFYQNLSINFILYYNIIYLLFVFNYIILLLFFQTTMFLSLITSWAFVMFLLAVILILVTFFMKFTNLGGFLVVSTSATSCLMLWALAIDSGSALQLMHCGTVFSSSILLYFYVYTLTALLLLMLLNNLGVSSATKSLSFVNSLLRFHPSALPTSKILLIMTLVSLAGLPPLLPFFIKLHVVSVFQNSLSFLLTTLTILFLFTMLFFYFKNVRFLLVQYFQTSQTHPLCYLELRNSRSRDKTAYLHIAVYSSADLYRNMLLSLLPIFLLIGFFFLADISTAVWLFLL